MTNASKAGIIALINAGIQVADEFGLDLSESQTTALSVFVNAGLALWVLLTKQNSPKRIPE